MKNRKYISIILILIFFCGILTYIYLENQSSVTENISNKKILISDLKQDMNCSAANISIYGEQNISRLGYSVSGVGDVNGDGLEDFIASAPYFDNSTNGNEGKVYLFFGKRSFWGLTINTSEADGSFIGENPNDEFGVKIAGAGDVNRDGFDDFLAVSYKNDQGGDDAGKIYLFLGKATGWEKDKSCLVADATFIGEYAEDRAGYSIDGVGDVNGDNYDDILISAIGFNKTASADEGKIYLFFGKANNWQKNVNCSTADVAFYGENIGDETGYCVAGVGDVNNDGFCDFLISSTKNDQADTDAGKVYLFFGKSFYMNDEINCSEANASYLGEDFENRAGWSISGAGDVNADGFDDFLIGSPYNEENGFRSGKTYLFFGKEKDWTLNVNCSMANVSYLGETEFQLSGSTVSSAGDINNDNYDDFLISAPLYNKTISYVGKVYLVYGMNSDNWVSKLRLDEANASFFGEGQEDFLGQKNSISGVGDINGDNCDDFIIAAYSNDGLGISTGKLYIFFGPNPISDGFIRISGYYFLSLLPICFTIGIILLFRTKKQIKY